MQQLPVPAVGPTVRTIMLNLLVAVVLAVTLVLAQLASREAPDPRPPAPRCRSGSPEVTRWRNERVGGRPRGPTAAPATPPLGYTLNRMWSTSPSRTT